MGSKEENLNLLVKVSTHLSQEEGADKVRGMTAVVTSGSTFQASMTGDLTLVCPC